MNGWKKWLLLLPLVALLLFSAAMAEVRTVPVTS